MQAVPEIWQDSWRADVLERSLRAAAGLAFVWEEGGQVRGFVCAHDIGFRGYLSELAVVSYLWKRRGCGEGISRGKDGEM